MKLKYIIPCLAVLVAAIFASCSDDNDATYLDEIRVSSSYVSLPVAGGETTITVTAKEDWTIKQIPEWLSVTPTSGVAGETTVKFSADAAEGRTAELLIVCGDAENAPVQHINVIQGIATVTPATCAQVLAGPESKTYQVTGTCTSIANTTYGNWYLNDGTGEVYIYGTLDAKGQTKNFTSLGIEVGDIVTVEGPKTLYGTTVELVDVTVIKIQKSLIKVDSVSAEKFPVEGGDITAFLTCKGEGVYVEIPEDAKDWLSIASITGGENPTVKFHASANDGGDRSTTLVLKTTKGGNEYTSELSVSQAGAIVTATVAEFLAAPVGATQFRLTGVISSVAKADYGNVYIRDYTGEAYVYGIGVKGDFAKLGLKEGDIVTVVGTRSAYKDSPQMAGGQYETHISVTPVTIAEFLTKPNSKDDYYMVSGTISSLKGSNGKDNDYGNLYITDGTNELYVYGCYPGWGATGDFRKGFIKSAGIEEGDILTMIGYKDEYNGLVELCGGTYFSHTKANSAE